MPWAGQVLKLCDNEWAKQRGLNKGITGDACEAVFAVFLLRAGFFDELNLSNAQVGLSYIPFLNGNCLFV